MGGVLNAANHAVGIASGISGMLQGTSLWLLPVRFTSLEHLTVTLFLNRREIIGLEARARNGGPRTQGPLQGYLMGGGAPRITSGFRNRNYIDLNVRELAE